MSADATLGSNLTKRDRFFWNVPHRVAGGWVGY